MYERGGDLDKIIIQDLTFGLCLRTEKMWHGTRHIQDCQFVSGMQPPGAGRNTIDPRVVSLYALMLKLDLLKTQLAL